MPNLRKSSLNVSLRDLRFPGEGKVGNYDVSLRGSAAHFSSHCADFNAFTIACTEQPLRRLRAEGGGAAEGLGLYAAVMKAALPDLLFQSFYGP